MTTTVPTGAPRWWRDGVAVAGAVTVGAMVATPLFPARGRGRRLMAPVVIGGLFTSTMAHAARRWGPTRALLAAGTSTATTVLAELLGTRTGFPFGAYRYTSALRPQVAGVPVIVPLAWVAMAFPARETAHAVLGSRSGPITRIALGAAAMTAWDLFLDPQMTGEGYWRWAQRGRYRGVPLVNFIGWFTVGMAVMAILEVFIPPEPEADRGLVGEYAAMAVMETVGFARFFRDPLVATVGGAAMLPLAATAIRRSRG